MNSKLSKIAGASVIAVSLAVMPLSLPVSAQNADPTAPTTTQTSPESNAPTIDTTPFQETKNDNNNWGWLGLLGLIGLANLFRKPKTAAYSDPNTVSSTTTRY
ncbi:MAG: WGxxGxxG-CTERM domain-containing protein [Chroococcus sp. CMT-3BRIN-NPC107]|jgi:predicted small lipoprotein YifL|nr:WGxxGxxG-CTERM domain-containing protein [Chroococcus sp. CMT-3BRIN-NPC107]